MDSNSASRKHDVSTFAGAVGGSVGVLSVLAIGLCISIRLRRHRARARDRRQRLAIAEPITSWDHGEGGPEGDDEERNFGRLRNTGQPMMAQAAPAPFVPRYFPGTVPASPPPYNAAAPSVTMSSASPFAMSLSRAGLPVSVPSTIPPTISSPAPALNLYRTGSNQSYAERPPPTPSSEEARITFGDDEPDTVRTGGINPLPPQSPVADETDPMLADPHETEAMREVYRDEPIGSLDDETSERRSSFTTRRHNFLRGSVSFSHSSRRTDPEAAGPSNSSTSSDKQFRRASSFSYNSNTAMSSLTSEGSSDSGPSTPRSNPTRTIAFDSSPPTEARTLSNSISLPQLNAPKPTRPLSELLSFPSTVDLNSKREVISYPFLPPSGIPLPLSTTGSANGSRESLDGHDSRR